MHLYELGGVGGVLLREVGYRDFEAVKREEVKRVMGEVMLLWTCWVGRERRSDVSNNDLYSNHTMFLDTVEGEVVSIRYGSCFIHSFQMHLPGHLLEGPRGHLRVLRSGSTAHGQNQVSSIAV